jgi:uncharacterized cupin superfamily protein
VPKKVTDVELLKKQVRKVAAGRVLAGEKADVALELAQLRGCRACITAGYGSLSKALQTVLHDRMIWILDGYAEVHGAGGQVTAISQGDSLVLPAGTPYRLVFPQLTIYLSVEATEEG